MDKTQHPPASKSKLILSYILFAIAAITAVSGVLIMTDIGQIFGIAKKVVVGFFENSTLIFITSAVTLLLAFIFYSRIKPLNKKWTIAILVVWGLCLISSKYLTPYFLFQTQQDNAKYISIAEAGDYMEDDERVLVVNHNGVQRAFPPEKIWMAHIFGGDYGGDEIVFTYCVMTNLASPYINPKGDKSMNLKVLAQTNNNLLLWDTKSDEIIQQITQQCEFSEERLDPVPVMEMTWRGFKKLFPKGEVLHNTWDTPVEMAANLVFNAEDVWYGEDWMFKTSNFDDQRLPSKEHIIGVRDDLNDQQLAITKEYIKKNGVVNISVGEQHLALSYFPEFETIVAFDRTVNGSPVDVTDLNIDGTTSEHGKLKQVYIYNSVLWAVWAHFYPESEVLM